MTHKIDVEVPVIISAARYGDKVKITMVDRRKEIVFESMFLLEYLNSLPDMSGGEDE